MRATIETSAGGVIYRWREGDLLPETAPPMAGKTSAGPEPRRSGTKER